MPHVQNGSLFDEGMRIAQQYGLSDLAGEIGNLQESNQTTDAPSIKSEPEQAPERHPFRSRR